MTDPTACITDTEVKFSDGMSSRPCTKQIATIQQCVGGPNTEQSTHFFFGGCWLPSIGGPSRARWCRRSRDPPPPAARSAASATASNTQTKSKKKKKKRMNKPQTPTSNGTHSQEREREREHVRWLRISPPSPAGTPARAHEPKPIHGTD